MDKMVLQKKYCSLDIETTGFDPTKDEILEVGFVFFEASSKGLKITSEYTQVFKPIKEVPAKILGLTGITQKELDSAPAFAEHRDYIQEQLRHAVIVGHNIIFDVRFLESVGIKFEGPTIDTLELVQFILPTHHSYNLENLMHFFRVSHEEAHRALADSKAALVLLEKLLSLYNSFSPELKKKIHQLLSFYQFAWKDLLDLNLPAFKVASVSFKKSFQKKQLDEPTFSLQFNRIYDFSTYNELLYNCVSAFYKQKILGLLVVPKISWVLELWQQGLVEPLFQQEDLFDETKFFKLLDRKGEWSADQVKFMLKVLVWFYTNWQTKTILDLNLSFFGGQFKSLITANKMKLLGRGRLLCCDMETFIYMAKQKQHSNRLVLLFGLGEFEQQLSLNSASKVSWGQISFFLRTVYNPELELGNKKIKKPVEEALLASDLFFGLVNALFETDIQGFQNIKITPEILLTEAFKKIIPASEHYCEKLLSLNKQIKSKEIENFAKNLRAFFTENEKNTVKWIELSEKRCAFFCSPLEIASDLKRITKKFPHFSFIDSLATHDLLKYFINRLGLSKFEVEKVKEIKRKRFLGQGLLFSKEEFEKIEVKFSDQLPSSEELSDLLLNVLPSAAVFGNNLELKEFYNLNYRQLQTKSFVLASLASGGSNKLFHNFFIHNNSVLLTTDKFILRHPSNQAGPNPIQNLPAKTLVLLHLPFEHFSHPYQQALAQQYAKPFEQYSLPRALYNFHKLLQFFYTPALKKIYIFDQKLGKSYSGVFKDYLQRFTA